MEKKMLCNEPIIYIMDNFLTNIECDHFVKISINNMKRSTVSSNNEGLLSNGRTSSNCWIKHNTDEITLNIANRIAENVGISIENAESYQVIHYSKSQLYNPHYDAYKKDGSDKSKRCLKYGGQRMITALVYLNDVEEGGNTIFPNLDISIKPKKGSMLVFHNCKEGTTDIHINSLHAGNPPIKGEKFAFNLWFREEPTNRIYNYYNK